MSFLPSSSSLYETQKSTAVAMTEIQDVRQPVHFKSNTFSNFKKGDVKKELLKSIYASKIESACYWCAEFICAGQFADLWDCIITFFSKYIHIGNPKLIMYLDMRLSTYENLSSSNQKNELVLRNNLKIRKLFCEIVCVLCESKKKHCYNEVKLISSDFDMQYMTERFKAPTTAYAKSIFSLNDPAELFIPCNELAYNIREHSKNGNSACYWIEWIMEYERIQKAKLEPVRCARREYSKHIDAKCQTDVIWIIWDMLLKECDNRQNEIIRRIVHSTLNIFCLKYRSSCVKKRKLLLYFIVELFTEEYILENEFIKDKQKLQTVLSNIDSIFVEIKKNEKTCLEEVEQTPLNKKMSVLNSLGNLTMHNT
jgi:hypothetical protein